MLGPICIKLAEFRQIASVDIKLSFTRLVRICIVLLLVVVVRVCVLIGIIVVVVFAVESVVGLCG